MSNAVMSAPAERVFGLSPAGAIATIIVVFSACRLIVAASIGMGVDESYVVAIARHWSLSYFDHPPLHFWIIHLTTLVTGSEDPLILRAPFIGLFALTTWLIYRIGSRLFDPWAGVVGAFLLNLSAVFTISSGGWVLPDGPLMAAMAAAALCLLPLADERAPDRALWLWIGAGVFGGLAMLSKYHGIFLFLGTLAFVLTHQAGRRWLLDPGPWLGAAAGAVIALPALIWNIRHDFVSIAFQGGRGMPGAGLHPERVLESIAGQAAYVLPWIFIPLAWVFLRTLLRGPRAAGPWLLVCLAAGPILVFTLVVLWGSRGLFHWQAPGWLFMFPLLGEAVVRRLRAGGQWIRRWLIGSAAAIAVLMVVLGSHTATGWLAGPFPELADNDPTVEAVDWTVVPAVLEEMQTADGDALGSPDFVVALHWLEAGKLDYVLGGRIPVVCFCDDPRHFAFITEPEDFVGRDAVIVGRRATVDRHADRALERFSVTGERIDRDQNRGGRTALQLSFQPAGDLTSAYRYPYPERHAP